VSECPFDREATPTAPLTPLKAAVDPRLALFDEYRAPLAESRQLARERCEARAFYRFARVPYATALAPDGSRVIGDLRYDRHRSLDFSDIRLTPRVGDCPRHVPPWLPPRADILSEDEAKPSLSNHETPD